MIGSFIVIFKGEGARGCGCSPASAALAEFQGYLPNLNFFLYCSEVSHELISGFGKIVYLPLFLFRAFLELADFLVASIRPLSSLQLGGCSEPHINHSRRFKSAALSIATISTLLYSLYWTSTRNMWSSHPLNGVKVVELAGLAPGTFSDLHTNVDERIGTKSLLSS